MIAITYLIPLSIVLAVVTFAGFLWTVRTDQYADPEGDAARMLEAEDVPLSSQERDNLRG